MQKCTSEHHCLAKICHCRRVIYVICHLWHLLTLESLFFVLFFPCFLVLIQFAHLVESISRNFHLGSAICACEVHRKLIQTLMEVMTWTAALAMCGQRSLKNNCSASLVNSSHISCNNNNNNFKKSHPVVW